MCPFKVLRTVCGTAWCHGAYTSCASHCSYLDVSAFAWARMTFPWKTDLPLENCPSPHTWDSSSSSLGQSSSLLCCHGILC